MRPLSGSQMVLFTLHDDPSVFMPLLPYCIGILQGCTRECLFQSEADDRETRSRPRPKFCGVSRGRIDLRFKIALIRLVKTRALRLSEISSPSLLGLCDLNGLGCRRWSELRAPTSVGFDYSHFLPCLAVPLRPRLITHTANGLVWTLVSFEAHAQCGLVCCIRFGCPRLDGVRIHLDVAFVAVRGPAAKPLYDFVRHPGSCHV